LQTSKLIEADNIYQGTGTAAGDPLELRAISETLGACRQAGREIIVGSVKPNVRIKTILDTNISILILTDRSPRSHSWFGWYHQGYLES
jgi:hypothetical protein